MAKRLSAVLVGVLSGAWAARVPDKIEKLPGLEGTLTAAQYSGYLDVNSAEGLVSFHYWLSEAEPEAAEAFKTAEDVPLVMWMNGGPGASSLTYGSFSELGPFYFDDHSMENKTEQGVPDVLRNPYSWTRVANMLFIESPPSVGFSYCAKKECRWNDTTTAEVNYAGLAKFFEEFEEYKGREFYIAGESYGGMYVPTLVEQIHRHGAESGINLKGFMVGNGIIGHRDTFPGAGKIHYEFLHAKAFISDPLWTELDKLCGEAWEKPAPQNYSQECQDTMAKASRLAGPFYVYDVYDSCGDDQLSLDEHLEAYHREAGYGGGLAGTSGVDPAVPCGKNRVAATWLNLPKVREAIHVHPESFYQNTTFPGPYQPSAPFKYWPTPGWNYNESRPFLLDVYPEFIEHYRTLIFSGDFDACVPYLFSEGWTNMLAEHRGWKADRAWEPWTVDHQTGGYVTQWTGPGANNFSFATVKGAGHMVPQYKPKQGLELFRSFIQNNAPIY